MMADEDVVAFASMMFVAGQQEGRGQDRAGLETLPPEEFAAAVKQVRVELATYKRLVKRRDR